MSNKHSYGYLRDLPDFRDKKYTSLLFAEFLPPKVSLRPYAHPVVDQGQLGSCVANAVCSAHVFDQMKQKAPHYFYGSRLFVYYNTRVIENTIQSDSGCQIRNAVKSVAKQGCCPETMYGYNVSLFRKSPPMAARVEALKHQAISYSRLTGAYQYKQCLASGFPFVFGISVYSSFESAVVARTGKVPMPKSSDSLLGGHALLCTGYDDTTRMYEFCNSWGMWGDRGYGYLPYDYLENTDLAADQWKISLVET